MTDILTLGYILFALGLMFFGHSSRFKIFCLFAIGPLWLLLMENSGNMLFSIILGGMIFWNGFYAFGGQLYD